MRAIILHGAALWFALAETTAPAAVRYVDVNGAAPTAPYTNWPTAATNIQDAVDAAQEGDEIVVTNGVYQAGGRAVYGSLTNRVAIIKPVTVRSVNGAEVTVIRGYQVPGTTNGDGAVRCAYLTNGAALVGFTLTKGATRLSGDYNLEQSGGGVWCESASALVSNCMLSGNAAFYGGGAYGGTLNNCTLTGNSACFSGGGAYGDYASLSILNNCTLTANSALAGGGAYASTLNNCTLTGNSAQYGGGGVNGGTLNSCTLMSNTAQSGGGVYSGECAECTLNNCTLTGNTAQYGGGAFGENFFPGALYNCTLSGNSASYGGGAYQATLDNCALTGNSASFEGGGVYTSPAAYGGVLNNCIVYYNAAPIAANYDGLSSLNYCCTTPLPPGYSGNFTNPPLLVNQAGGDLRLQSNSPCINAGLNAYAPAGFDLDGHPRIVGGTVDVGAYEFQAPSSLLSYAWLQQFGLPTDGSADYTDPDGDGLNNWQEWRAGTDPTNALSVLRLLTPKPGPAGIAVSWQSVADRTYFLERSTNLGVAPIFLALASNIVGQAGATTLTDSNVAGLGPFFYRVGVQE